MASSSYRQRVVEPVRQQPSPRYISNDDDQPVRTRPKTVYTNVTATPLTENVWQYDYPWSVTLCSCCSNMKQCCCAFCCPWCFECQLYKRVGENLCTCVCPGGLFALRAKIRTALRIEGSLCGDCCVTTFCSCCATVQMARELTIQGF